MRARPVILGIATGVVLAGTAYAVDLAGGHNEQPHSATTPTVQPAPIEMAQPLNVEPGAPAAEGQTSQPVTTPSAPAPDATAPATSATDTPSSQQQPSSAPTPEPSPFGCSTSSNACFVDSNDPNTPQP